MDLNCHMIWPPMLRLPSLWASLVPWTATPLSPVPWTPAPIHNCSCRGRRSHAPCMAACFYASCVVGARAGRPDASPLRTPALAIWPLAFCCCALVCMRAYCILCKTIIRMHVYCMPLCVRMRAYCLLCFLRARCRHAATPARGGPPGATTPAAARRACCCTCSWRSLASVSLPARTR